MKHLRTLAASTAIIGTLGATKLPRDRSGYIADKFQTFDKAQMDSAGAFLIGELERLDPKIHLPLAAVTWQRDIDLRTDVQMGDESSSYTLTNFGSTGGVQSNGINWASKSQTAIARTTIDIGKIVSPLNLVSYEIGYTIPELLSAQQTGRPIDTQMLQGMALKHQMDTDQVVYIGDQSIILAGGNALTGLVNSINVTNVTTVAADGTSGSTLFSSKTPQQILRDINELLRSVWAATGYSIPPSKLLLSPAAFNYVSTTAVTIGTTGTADTILSYIKTRNILTAERDLPLDIQSCKWLDKTIRGVSTDRMVAYIQSDEFVRFPMVPLQSVAPQYSGLYVNMPYFGRLGVVETVYPETIGYADGIF